MLLRILPVSLSAALTSLDAVEVRNEYAPMTVTLVLRGLNVLLQFVVASSECTWLALILPPVYLRATQSMEFNGALTPESGFPEQTSGSRRIVVVDCSFGCVGIGLWLVVYFQK